jgi:hypothetical protein
MKRESNNTTFAVVKSDRLSQAATLAASIDLQ